MSNTHPKKRNRGGQAIAIAEESTAIGGNAGPSSEMAGGRGGDAHATLPGSTVVGGNGGRGGVDEGMAGMDMSDRGVVGGTVLYCEGGMGGEAGQSDGRGGRGGVPGAYERLGELLGWKLRPHMKQPYWPDDQVEFGRGGDAPDSPQYKARRLIIEMIKAEHMGAQTYFSTEVWYEREAVSIDQINRALARMRSNWRVSLDDHEYVMHDLNVCSQSEIEGVRR